MLFVLVLMLIIIPGCGEGNSIPAPPTPFPTMISNASLATAAPIPTSMLPGTGLVSGAITPKRYYDDKNLNAAVFFPNQADEIKIFVGMPDGTVGISQYADYSGNYQLTGVKAGNYFICAFLDKNKNGKVDAADKFGFIKGVQVNAGREATNTNITLTEANTTDAPLLNEYLKRILK